MLDIIGVIYLVGAIIVAWYVIGKIDNEEKIKGYYDRKQSQAIAILTGLFCGGFWPVLLTIYIIIELSLKYIFKNELNHIIDEIEKEE